MQVIPRVRELLAWARRDPEISPVRRCAPPSNGGRRGMPRNRRVLLRLRWRPQPAVHSGRAVRPFSQLRLAAASPAIVMPEGPRSYPPGHSASGQSRPGSAPAGTPAGRRASTAGRRPGRRAAHDRTGCASWRRAWW